MEPLTNNICKAVAALDEREGAFKAEGTKCVLDTIGHFNLRALYATQEWLDEHPDFSGRRNV